MATYAVHGTIKTHSADWHGCVQVPTFYLDSRVQGILNAEHATDIARSIINPLGTIERADMNVKAYLVDPARESSELAAAEHDRAVQADAGHAEWCAGTMAHYQAMPA